ncbi:MAG: TlpA disulfide reductase family protein [Candidatus Poribacteria bacterium]|nr:TlpA disulfide reductase family protein [Candidatus Poribacteria bacterium]
MREKYDSTDFWYTFLNSLYNFGLASGRGELEMDEEMQEKYLVYLKEKIEEGVTNGQTALPPGLHDYFWRFPKEMLPKLRKLAEGFLDTDPENPPATIILTIVAGEERDSEYQTHLETLMRLIPKDPGANLIIINEFHRSSGSLRGKFDGEDTFLTVLENLYEWAKQEGATDRYQDVKSAYYDIGRSPGTPYGRAKKKLKELKEEPENSENQKERRDQFEKCKAQIKRCISLFYEEHAAFQKELLHDADDKQDLGDPTSEQIDFWETYLNSLDDQELSSSNWKLTPTIQTQLLTYFKTRIEYGVVDGKTALPTDLQEFIPKLPKVLRIELREFAEKAFEKLPNNGAAAKLLAIIENDEEFPYLEQAIELLTNDAEICFFAIKRYSESFGNRRDPSFELTLPTLEKLFAIAQQQDESELYHWITKLYNEIGRTPCHIYRKLMRQPEGNAELIELCQLLIKQTEQSFKHRLEKDPDDWYALRGLGDIYQTLGKTELAQEYPWESHPEYRWTQKAWEGLQLPDFTATTLNGTEISFSDYKGKLVLLNYCGWWCGPCKGEIPYIKQVYEEHHKNGFEVIRISIDESEEDLRKHIEEYEIPGVQVFGDYSMTNGPAKYYGIYWVPSHWLIDRDGKIISVDSRQDPLVRIVNWTESTRVSEIVPDFSAVDIDGNPVSPSAFRGKVVLLYFGYPEQVLTCVDTIYQKYHVKGFDVIGVSVIGWSNEEALRKRVHEKNFLGQHIYDGGGMDGPLARLFGMDLWRELPAIVLIDKDGKVITSRYGKVHSTEEWTAKLERQVATHLGL